MIPPFVCDFISKIPGFPAIFKALYLVEDKRLETEVFGLKFKNPVGLAAGFDKDAKLYNELSNFGFGFMDSLQILICEFAGT